MRKALWQRPAALSALTALLLLASLPVQAGAAVREKARVHFFWGEGCPYCEKEKGVFKELEEKHPGAFELRSYEVWKNPGNAALLKKTFEALGVKAVGVPVTIINDRIWVGFSDATPAEIEEEILRGRESGVPDLMELAARKNNQEAAGPLDEGRKINVPVIGEVTPESFSLPVFTLMLGALDSLNPCAFFILLFLLSLLVHARSRGRMLFIGMTFVFFSGLFYFLFMAAWLNVFKLVGEMKYITMAAGGVALLVASINIKDFFLFGQGPSLSIPEGAKPGLFARMRGLVSATSLGSMAAGTVVLALAANSYELLCTAGFPMVFTRVLTLRQLDTSTYYMYLAFYNIVYVAPLAAIVSIFAVTLGGRKLSEWQGRKLKLLSGIMMLLLGLVLIIDPSILDNVIASAGILAAAVISTWLVVVISRRFVRGAPAP